MSERINNLKEMIISQKNQEPEITPENENIQESSDTEQAKDEAASTETKSKIEKIKEMRLQKNQEPEITEEIEELDIDESEIIHCNTVVNSKNNAESGDLSIINSEAKGKNKRLLLSKRLMEFCDNSPTVQISLLKDIVLIAPEISEGCSSYIIRKGSKDTKGTIYNGELVLLMTKHFGLEFGDGRSCRTFPQFTVKNYNGKKVAVIKMK